MVFKTDIENQEKLQLIKPVFDDQHSIIEWSVDIQDIDKVLRIETNMSMNEHQVIELMTKVDALIIVTSAIAPP